MNNNINNIQGFTLKDGTKLQCLFENEKGEKTSYFYDGTFCYIVSSFDSFDNYYSEDTDTFYGYELNSLPGDSFTDKITAISEIGFDGKLLPIKSSVRDFIFRHYYKNFKEFTHSNDSNKSYSFKKKYLENSNM